MLRDRLGRPVGDHFVHHGTDVETVWEGEVPYLTPNDRFFVRNPPGRRRRRILAVAGDR